MQNFKTSKQAFGLQNGQNWLLNGQNQLFRGVGGVPEIFLSQWNAHIFVSMIQNFKFLRYALIGFYQRWREKKERSYIAGSAQLYFWKSAVIFQKSAVIFRKSAVIFPDERGCIPGRAWLHCCMQKSCHLSANRWRMHFARTKIIFFLTQCIGNLQTWLNMIQIHTHHACVRWSCIMHHAFIYTFVCIYHHV